MPNSNETLFDELIIALIVIERFKSSIAKKIKNILLNVNDEILKEVLTVVLSLKNISELKGRKLKNVLNKIEEITGESFDKVEEKTTAALLVLIPLLVNSTNKIINKSVGVGVSSVTLSDKKIADILNNAVIDGKFIADWWKRAELKTTEAIKSAIKQGIFDRIIIESQRGISKGESIDDITNRIKDVIGVNSKQAASVSDTIIAQVTNTVREYVFKQNEGLISGYKFVAILDNRTTPKCRALDSKMFDENKNPVGHNLQMIPPSGPPLHVRCRSVLMPILKSRSDVSEEMDEILKEQTNSQREAMNGNVPANTTYDDWLKKQSVELQKEILGLKKYEIWKKNKLTMADLVDQTANPLTVKELISKWGEP